MLEIKGKHNQANVFTDTLEELAEHQIRQLCDMEFFADSQIRIMPDVHAGAGCTIGTTMTITDKVVPNLVGVDIGCGMETVRIAEKKIDFKKLDELIYREIPFGRDIRKRPHAYDREIDLYDLHCAHQVNIERARRSIGTLGGGNHFIEVDKGEDGSLYLVVHSGSRYLGKQIAELYQNEAWRRINGNSKEDIEQLIRTYKAEGRAQEISEAIKALKQQVNEQVPRELSYLEGEMCEQYLDDMHIAQRYAALNRQAMADVIVSGMGFHVEEQWTTIHNYIDTASRILRKGAVSAAKGEKILIPVNMRDGSFICIGKGNDDWNCSAPHGAGRLMSRRKAFASLSLEQFKKSMEGIYTTSANQDTLDESPQAYKPMDEILKHIVETAEVVEVIRPVYNFKAAG